MNFSGKNILEPTTDGSLNARAESPSAVHEACCEYHCKIYTNIVRCENNKSGKPNFRNRSSDVAFVGPQLKTLGRLVIETCLWRRLYLSLHFFDMHTAINELFEGRCIDENRSRFKMTTQCVTARVQETKEIP